MKFKKHHTAVIDEGAKIGENSRIWHFSHICSKAKIGKNVTIGQNAYVADYVEIGDNCSIQNNVSIYTGVILEEGVFCGPSMVFTNVYNPRAIIDRKKEYKKTIVKKNVSLGANCTVLCGITVGESAFIGAGSFINKNIKAFALMVGLPAVQIGWISNQGERIPLPLEGNGSYQCPVDGLIYQLKGKHMDIDYENSIY